MERELEKTLLEIEHLIDEHERRGNTHTQSVLQIAHEIIEPCAKAARTLSELEEVISRENTPEITRLSRDNDGWIPVEERLPTMEEYQKNDGRFILDDGNRRCGGYFDVYTGRFYSYRHITPYRAELYENNVIAAWRPLPDPYRPERSNDEKE